MKTRTEYEAKKIKQGRCIEYRCAKPHRKENGYRCDRCKSRRFKEQRPAAYFYNLLRCNAKRRGHEFEITLEEFSQWCQATGYLDKKGRKPKDYTIDRIDINQGYSLDNIQLMTNGENVRKYHTYESKGIPHPTLVATTCNNLPSDLDQLDDLPF